ncbi:MAG: hypothetical protein NVSMB17_07220 [Candidatus Dormibacteria bacterium]
MTTGKRIPGVVAIGTVFALLAPLMARFGVQGDGVGYFAYLPALFRGSFDMGPAYRDFLNAHVALDASQLHHLTAAGLPDNQFAVGSAVMGAPFYALTRLVGAVGGGGGAQTATWPPGEFAFNVAAMLLCLAGIVLTYRLCENIVGAGPALAATGAMALGSPLLFYTFLDSSYAHAFSVFAVAAFTCVTLQLNAARSPWWWVLAGLFAGLVAATRLQDAVYLLLLVIPLAALPRGRVVMKLAPLLVGTALGFAPEVVVTRLVEARWIPQAPPGMTFDFFHPHLVEFLVSSRHGLLLWSPVVVLGFVGLVLELRRRQALAGVVLAALLLQVLVNAGSNEWFAGASFGARRFVGAYPLLVLGTAMFFAHLKPRVRKPAALVVVLAVAWSLVLAASYSYLLPAAADPGIGALLRGQVAAIRLVPRLLLGGSLVRAVTGSAAAGNLGGAFTGALMGVLLALGCSLVAAGIGRLARPAARV